MFILCVWFSFQLVSCVPVTAVENRPSRQVGNRNSTDFEPDVVVCKRYETIVKVVILFHLLQFEFGNLIR